MATSGKPTPTRASTNWPRPSPRTACCNRSSSGPTRKASIPSSPAAAGSTALQHLAKAGKFDPDASIDCHVISAEADATEISLVENALREQMHPADQFEDFRELVDKGIKITDIASRFGVTEDRLELTAA
jgi:hypothetical protein